MSTFLWLSLMIVSLLCGVIIYYRLAEPISSKMGREQEQLNKKMGMGDKVSTTTSTSVNLYKKGGAWPEKVLSWNVMLILLGATVLYWGNTPMLRSADVGEWSKNHWLQIFLFCGLLWGLIALNAESLKTAAGVLQRILAGIAIMLLVVLPFWSWISSPPEASVPPTARALPQDGSGGLPRAWNTDGTITDTTKWPKVQVPPHSDSTHVPHNFDGHLVWLSGFEVHCLYADGHEGIIGDRDRPCSNGDIVASYVHNDGDAPQEASYAYASRFEK
ncbi:hypothetical protein HZA87_01725 [Candidatus Uhrbacteria bacterium]|nr:hypothetical protein [Candidatus Uhrbacteria bacterium]